MPQAEFRTDDSSRCLEATELTGVLLSAHRMAAGRNRPALHPAAYFMAMRTRPALSESPSYATFRGRATRMRATAIVFVGNNTYEHVGRASTLDAPVVDDTVVVRVQRRRRNSTNGLFWTVQAIAPLPKSRSGASSS